MIKRLVLGFALLFPIFGEGEDISLFFPTGQNVSSALGLSLNDGKLEEGINSKVVVVEPNLVAVSFGLSSSNQEPAFGKDTLVTAILKSENGSLEVGPLRSLGSLTAARSLQVCEEALPPIELLVTQEGALASLADVRTARLQVAKEKFMSELSTFGNSRIKTIENGFGLTTPASPTLEEVNDPFTLVDRLLRLYHAVHLYAAAKANGSSIESSKEES
jgi:hypothetical protein